MLPPRDDAEDGRGRPQLLLSPVVSGRRRPSVAVTGASEPMLPAGGEKNHNSVRTGFQQRPRFMLTRRFAPNRRCEGRRRARRPSYCMRPARGGRGVRARWLSRAGERLRSARGPRRAGRATGAARARVPLGVRSARDTGAAQPDRTRGRCGCSCGTWRDGTTDVVFDPWSFWGGWRCSCHDRASTWLVGDEDASAFDPCS
jgi:hypothetical protein